MTKASIQRELKELKLKYKAKSQKKGDAPYLQEMAMDKANEEINKKYGMHWRKSKFQKEILAITPSLPELTEGEERWMLQNVLYHKIYVLKNGQHSCMDCGHQWHEKKDPTTLASILSKMECPSCKVKGTVEATRKRKYHDSAECKKIHTYKGYQIISIYNVIGIYKAGESKWTNIVCLSNTIIDTKVNKFLVYGKAKVQGYGYMGGAWTGDTMLRDKHMAWSNDVSTYKTLPKKTYTKELKMRGIKNTHYGMGTFEFMFNLLKFPQFETLLKSKRTDLLNACKDNGPKIVQYWSTIKMCIKHKYFPSDVRDYLDYLRLLEMFNRDLRSIKYIFPQDLHREHSRYVEKAKVRREKLNRIEQIKRMKEEEIAYANKKTVLGFKFSSGNYSFKTLDTVSEYKEEGDELKHCVYTMSYYDKKSSICISVRFKGKRTETIQIGLADFKIIQSRGWDNKRSKHHKAVIEIMSNNINLLQKHIADGKKKKTRKKKQPLKQVA